MIIINGGLVFAGKGHRWDIRLNGHDGFITALQPVVIRYGQRDRVGTER